LLKFVVMDIHPVDQLPATTKLISSICSCRQKRLPKCELLEHKSYICINSKNSSFAMTFGRPILPLFHGSPSDGGKMAKLAEAFLGNRFGQILSLSFIRKVIGIIFNFLTVLNVSLTTLASSSRDSASC
jgi:hypothetical protein